MAPLALAALSAPLGAQVTMRATVGGTVSTTLIDDNFLLTKEKLTPAPTVDVAVTLPTGHGYRVLFEADMRHADIEAASSFPVATGNDRIGSVTTIDGLILGEGDLWRHFRWQAGGGIVWFRPSEDEGIFQDGSTTSWVLTAGILWSRPLTHTWNVLAGGRIDHQNFTTGALEDRGYIGGQSLIRFALTAGLEWTL